MVEDRARAEERKEVIDVVEELILNWKEIFVVSREKPVWERHAAQVWP